MAESPNTFTLPQARMKKSGGLSSVEWPLRRCIIWPKLWPATM
jgi:hypothetical protein